MKNKIIIGALVAALLSGIGIKSEIINKDVAIDTEPWKIKNVAIDTEPWNVKEVAIDTEPWSITNNA